LWLDKFHHHYIYIYIYSLCSPNLVEIRIPKKFSVYLHPIETEQKFLRNPNLNEINAHHTLLTHWSWCLHVSQWCNEINAHHTLLTHWSWCLHVSQWCITWSWPHYHGLLTLIFFLVQLTISLLTYNLDYLESSHLAHTLIVDVHVWQAIVTWFWPHSHVLLTF